MKHGQFSIFESVRILRNQLYYSDYKHDKIPMQRIGLRQEYLQFTINDRIKDRLAFDRPGLSLTSSQFLPTPYQATSKQIHIHYVHSLPFTTLDSEFVTSRSTFLPSVVLLSCLLLSLHRPLSFLLLFCQNPLLYSMPRCRKNTHSPLKN